ncbi:MAG: hypothetical protein EOP88_02825 [Verrucomicrobiaceae bacterium]|nr:MAG: hypothetical protein EOP88_02825 [Verrucomicrobiaceae bacterium]
MTRRTAAIIATGVSLLVGGYVAWCGRSFYLKPRMVCPEWMPAEVMAMLPEAAVKEGLMVPEEFDTGRLLGYLGNPYQAAGRDEITAFRSEPDMIIAGRSGPGQPRSIYFVWKMVRWEMMTEEEFHDSFK